MWLVKLQGGFSVLSHSAHISQTNCFLHPQVCQHGFMYNNWHNALSLQNTITFIQQLNQKKNTSLLAFHYVCWMYCIFTPVVINIIKILSSLNVIFCWMPKGSVPLKQRDCVINAVDTFSYLNNWISNCVVSESNEVKWELKHETADMCFTWKHYI